MKRCLASFSSFSCGTVLTKDLISQESKIAAAPRRNSSTPHAAEEHLLISGALEGDDRGHPALAGAGCAGNTLQHHGSREGPNGTLGHRFLGEGRRFTFRVAFLSMHSSVGYGGGWSSLPSMSPKDRGTKSAELPARAPLGGWGELAAQVAAAPKENGVSHCPEGKELLLPPAVFWCVSHPQGMEPRSSPRLEVCEMGFVAEFHSSGSCGGGQGSSSSTLPRAVVRCFSSPGNPRSPWGCAGI